MRASLGSPPTWFPVVNTKMQANTHMHIHTASFRCRRLGLTCSIRSHNNYFKLLRGTQVLVGYITSTPTRDGFPPAHTYTTTFWLYIYLYKYIFVCAHVCVCAGGHKHTCTCAFMLVYVLEKEHPPAMCA